MAAINDGSVRVADIFARPIHLIDPDPENTRDITGPVAVADIEEIAHSILNRGFDPDRALLVRKMPGGRWMVTDGHKRREAVLRAIKLGAKISAVPCRSETLGTDEQDRAILRLRDPGRALSPLEAVIDIKRLLGWNWSEKQIADKLGKRVEWVRQCLELAGAPIEVREAVRSGELAPTEARRVAREADPVATLNGAREQARSEGRDRIRTRDVAAVSKSRTEGPSLCSLAIAAVRAWRDGGDVDAAMGALEAALGPLARAPHVNGDAARGVEAGK